MSKSNIILLFGENTFEIHEKIAFWKKAFIEKYSGDINIDEFDGNTAPNLILEAASAFPFLSEKRLVFVKRFLADQKTEAHKKMADGLDEVPETCVLIFVEITPPDKRTSLFKKLQKIARVEEYKSLTGDLLIRWILKETEAKDGKISWSTAAYLGNLIGPDLWLLHNEIAKLIAYAAATPITNEMVDQLVSGGNIITSIFKLTDSLGQKRVQESLKILHQLTDKGEELPMIFGMLTRQFRLIIQIQELQKLGQSPPQIANHLKQHPYAVSSILPQCQNFTPEALKTIYRKLLAIDFGLKTGAFKYQVNDQTEYLLQIEKLIVEACG